MGSADVGIVYIKMMLEEPLNGSREKSELRNVIIDRGLELVDVKGTALKELPATRLDSQFCHVYCTEDGDL